MSTPTFAVICIFKDPTLNFFHLVLIQQCLFRELTCLSAPTCGGLPVQLGKQTWRLHQRRARQTCRSHWQRNQHPWSDPFQPELLRSFSDQDVSVAPVCRKKGKGREATRSGLRALEAWRGGRANRAFRHLAASGAVPVCGVPFLVESIAKISRRSVGAFAFVVHV